MITRQRIIHPPIPRNATPEIVKIYLDARVLREKWLPIARAESMRKADQLLNRRS